ncbi:metallophosphatase family protein [Streptomyces sp. Je 1-4]|uniref:metallophosphoesterase family protein n=1 Tax=Streptomyces TaxID=1883 RepID=UPI0021DB034C|nr:MULTISPECIES: metallophosphoesterase family protein [unclassified Streptomyces]UYB43235.1 metallophosphatase family protein [Streptomyces sp. Je 1-4]UZQ39602.1 metallophosphatase family protein [Streptomyces sp. Je 1-4] [Streptomyces sp. Je 1-4 4N24]UZQ47019.1 metallophosphatase family protein [Streptomyces sp. Je 1-4] [Streptomyces sp. Je 1-4 4N24_ara]
MDTSDPGSDAGPASVGPRGAGVAVLSDIHAVLPALEAVLAEPDVHAADRIVLTGDLLAGPLPRQTLALLRGLGDRAVWISGNADREMAAVRQGTGDAPADAMDAWAAGQLGPDDLDFLGSLPATATLEVTGLGPVLFCHATPRNDTEIALVDSRPERWAEVLEGVPDAVRTVVCGHTHMPFVRFTHGRLVVNPGSVGMPYGRPGAHWALLGPGGGAVTLRHTAFDHEAACARIARESDSPSAAAWADTYVRARTSAEEALAAFGPGDGREAAPGTGG